MADLLILYDGECGICNHWVDFVIQRDKNRHFKYAPLQGETIETLPQDVKEVAKNIDSILLWDGSSLLIYSTAVLKVFTLLPGSYKLLGKIGLVFPKFIRDGVYKFFAKIRHQLLPAKIACRIPSEEERGFLLP